MKYISFIILFCVANVIAKADVWYVTDNGNDNNNGKSASSSFRTLQKASDLAAPGDVVLIGDGDYTDRNQKEGSSVLFITKSGKPGAWITYKAMPNSTPVIKPVGWHGIQISASYIVIDGLTVMGNNDSIVLLDALNDAKNKSPNAFYNTNGISIEGRNIDNKPHHIIIRNTTVGKCAGGGISALEADYVTIEDCNVFGNAWFMRYGGSGITTLNNWAFDDAPGYHIIIQRNMVWDNKTLVPWERINKLSDGNGILLDVTDLKRNGATNPNADAVISESQQEENKKSTVAAKKQRPEWKGRALIANNVSAYNGGSGIHTFRTKYVDIINNTTYWNGQIVGYQELFPNNSEDITILNNIIVPRPGGKVTSNNKNTNIKWDYNIYPDSQQVFVGKNDIVGNPLFKNIKLDLRESDFRLSKKSPAINSGTDELAQPTDILNKKRPKGKKRDRGAFEQ